MAKKLLTVVKLQIPAGKANPAPPIGPALGQHGVQIAEFCKQFNDRTKTMGDTVVPVEISIFEDRSFKFITKVAPASFLLRKAAGAEKGSDEPNKKKVGTVTVKQLEEIAKQKMPDLNTVDLPAAVKTLAGTARSMGITVEK